MKLKIQMSSKSLMKFKESQSALSTAKPIIDQHERLRTVIASKDLDVNEVI